MTDHRSRRWFQLSLKSLFLMTLVVAVAVAGYSRAMKRAEAQRRFDTFGYDPSQSREPFDQWPGLRELPDPGDPFAQPPLGQRDDSPPAP